MRGLLVLALGACSAPERAACQSMCEQLVSSCGVSAFPSAASCEEGCRYEGGEGAELGAMEICLHEAQCDLFEIVACGRSHGGTP
jgi:hypothetical protein